MCHLKYITAHWCTLDLFIAFYLFCSTLDDVIILVLQPRASSGKVRNEKGRKYSEQTSERERVNCWLDIMADLCQKMFAGVNAKENKKEN